MGLRTLIVPPNNKDMKKKTNIIFLNILITCLKLLVPYSQYFGNGVTILVTFHMA